MKLMDKKGQGALQGLQAFILGIVGVAIVLVVGIIVVAELQGSTTNVNASDAAGTVISKLTTIPTWIGILIVVGMAFLVLAFFYGKSNM